MPNIAFFMNHPLSSLSIVALLMATVLCWMPRLKELCQLTLLAFLVLGLLAGHITFVGAVILGILYYYLFHLSRSYRENPILSLIFFLAGAAAYLHFLPGFQNWLLINNVEPSPLSLPYRAYFNYDKYCIGVMLLATLPLSKSFQDVLAAVKHTFLPIVLCVGVLMAGAYALGYITYDPKLPPIWPLWVVHNLFFVVVAEEVFFRGFIQRKLTTFCSKQQWSPMLALVLTSVLFGLYHYTGGALYVFLSSIAGLFYGYVYLKTERIEVSMALHFLVNFLHFLFFTYPMAKTVLE